MSALQLIDKLLAKLAAAQFVAEPQADAAWRPELPAGHTEFSWGGPEEDEKAAAAAAQPVRAPAAAAAAAAPAPAAPPAKQGGVGSAKGKDEAKKDKEPKKQQQKPAAAPAAAAAAAAPAPALNQPPFTQLDLRVGRIVKCWKHPNADKLWVEDVDIGEAEPRRICSGLAQEPLVPLEKMLGASVVVLANLKAVELRKERSHGMILAASSDDHKQAELVGAPAGAKIGERVFLQGQSAADRALAPAPEIDGKAKESAWTIVAAKLRTNAEGVVCFDGAPLVASSGPVACGMKNSIVK
jgi:aminoacyl tRNA synthase complex-interacting multifunctional protein 1